MIVEYRNWDDCGEAKLDLSFGGGKMKKWIFIFIILLLLVPACSNVMPTSPPEPTPTIDESLATPESEYPQVVGPEPSERIAAFYYPWYGNKETNGEWIHWEQANNHPPTDIGADYYPLLGTYSALDPVVVAQHFAWLREAGVGVIISSWWGRQSNENVAVPLLLEMGERYGIKVAFHIENYGGRSANRLVQDIKYLYQNYSEHPAFFRTTTSSRWSPDDRPKGLFFLWASVAPDGESPAVEPSYWQEALDEIHALPDGGLVITDQNSSQWIDQGHFDGSYNYGVLSFNLESGYKWARSLPADALYFPGVNPGFSAERIHYSSDTDTPRNAGETYEDRWQMALDVDIEPEMVVITTFNEWHEGTQIEPAESGVLDSLGQPYKDYDPLPPEGYLQLTRKWVDTFLAMDWPEFDTQRVRIRLATTSDWTDFNLVSGGTWLRPTIVSSSESAQTASLIDGHFALNQPIAQAEAGNLIEMIVDIQFADIDSDGTLVFEITRGNIGMTWVEFYSYADGEPELIETVRWGGITGDGRNTRSIELQADALFGDAP
jgi:glycoprotein endo-alpha-1,2-mannosidase